ncbi:hypothetical protein N1851_012552 [Merluccius polli]|uniref:Uncharacterized protein n=1 Tax=Merluccius polli TaxID=89951 RepID=A0AA47P267_MERPO|nr:hypothetical protein N1851_012552 [Merluccius polli]
MTMVEVLPPFKMSLAPPLFTRCMAATMSPLQAGGMSIPPDLDEWLTQSRAQAVTETAALVSYVTNLGLMVNFIKSLVRGHCAGFSANDRNPLPMPCVAPEGPELLITACDLAVVETILNARAPSTKALYANSHIKVDGQTIGSYGLVSRFMKGVKRLRPPQLRTVPSWHLTLVLGILSQPPFQPLCQTDLKWLSFKKAFLLATAWAQRVSEILAHQV